MVWRWSDFFNDNADPPDDIGVDAADRFQRLLFVLTHALEHDAVSASDPRKGAEDVEVETTPPSMTKYCQGMPA
jgi:hypothetical protein